MKKKLIPFTLSLLTLCACQTNTPTEKPTEDLKPTETATDTPVTDKPSYRPNVFEQLSAAFGDLTGSMTLNGRVSHATSDGTNNTESYTDATIEISADAYYYLEEDESTHEKLVEENCYEGTDGKLVNRTLDPLTNEIVETKTSDDFNQKMDNPFGELEVKNISAIREQPNWYIINKASTSLASRIVYYLTGYQTTGLPDYSPSYDYTTEDYTPSVSEFAIHFNGDEIDQFRFILELEISEDDGTYYYEGLLFELDISELGNTTPREMQPLEHTDGHDRLKSALQPYSYDNQNARNYTVHVDVGFDTNQLTGYSYEYYVDFDKKMIYNTYEFTGYIAPKTEDDEYEEYKYNFCYQFDEENQRLYIYRYLADESHKFVRKDGFREYWGYSDTEMGTSFFDGAPMIGALAPECFADNGDDTFSPYTIYQSLAIRSLLPFEEYVNEPTTSGNFKVVLNKDGTLNSFQNSITGNFAVGTSLTVQATKTFKTTITNLGNTSIPSYCVNIKD